MKTISHSKINQKGETNEYQRIRIKSNKERRGKATGQHCSDKRGVEGDQLFNEWASLRHHKAYVKYI